VNLKQRYLSGKITGLSPEEVEAKFALAEIKFPDLNFNVINPVTLCADIDRNAHWQEYMKRCIAYLTKADLVYALPCHTESRGAQLEIYIALSLGIKIIYGTL
jgi:hypothetical protein